MVRPAAWRLLAGLLAAMCASAAPALYIAVRSFWFERENYVAPAPQPLLRHPDMTGIPGLSSVVFQTVDGLTIAGWFAHRKTGATVILLHGTNADRSSLLWEARALARAGFGVLLFDWPGYGLSGGRIHWGRGAEQALGSALDWLVRDVQVDPGRIGAFGFSAGGYVLAQVAARDGRVGAVALAATPTDLADEAKWEYRRHGALSIVPALWALDWESDPKPDAPAIQAVTRIHPRPVLLIGGSEDPTVPGWMVKALYDAAGDPKQIWIAPGAHHGGYAAVAPADYEKTLVEFFAHSLLGSCPSQATVACP